MYNLSDNYYKRESYFKGKQVPTQTVMINNMGSSLANIYFKSMKFSLKVLAGLEPPLKGGGVEWYVPPEEILKGKAVLKPQKKTYLSKLGSDGIVHFGELIINHNHKINHMQKLKVLQESDDNWKKVATVSSRVHHDDVSKQAAEKNTRAIHLPLNEYIAMFNTSLTNIENLLRDSAIEEIKIMKQEAYDKMKEMLKSRVEIQANRLYKYYNDKLNSQKERRKGMFVKKIEKGRTIMAIKIHDLRLHKHWIVEKLRHYLQVQNLACQFYVAVKEKEACYIQTDVMEYEHNKKVKVFKEQLAMKDFEIRLAQEKEQKRMEFKNIWKNKVCEVVKKLQMFVSYCLSSLPEYADFFIDMEKLMLLQLNEVYENPQAANIFEPDKNEFHTPVPKPHPFYLVCDKGNKPKIDENICPKHCTSSASHMPVIVVNKRCIYAACDNFDEFTTKVTEFVHGRRGDDIDFEDPHDYTNDVPIKYTAQEQLQELQLESSLFQLLQKERPNSFNLDLRCCTKCSIPFCFCTDKSVEGKVKTRKGDSSSTISVKFTTPAVTAVTSKATLLSDHKIDTRSKEPIHEREPNLKGYMDYLLPMKCKCVKTAKKHLEEHLPSYMTSTSKYESLELPNYEKCPLETLKKLVRKAQKKVTPPPLSPVEVKYREIGTQYSDQQFDMLCTCFSDDEVNALFKDILKGATLDESEQFKTVGVDMSPSLLTRNTSSFATECAYELRSVLDDSPELREIFKKKNCSFGD